MQKKFETKSSGGRGFGSNQSLKLFHVEFFSILISMNRLCWNVRGLGKPEKRRAIKKMVKKNKVDLLFFCRRQKSLIMLIALFMNYGDLIIVDGIGSPQLVLQGGLSLFGMKMCLKGWMSSSPRGS